MLERKTSIFYESFYAAISDLEEQDFVKMMKAYCDYTFYGKEPELSGYLLAMWKLMLPVLEKNNQLYANGSKGGRPRKDKEPNAEPCRGSDITSLEPSENQIETIRKPNRNSNDLYMDEDKDVDKDEDLDKYFSISAKAAGAREREEFLKILLFEKKVLCPQVELERFLNHYAKCGWVDANGNPIRNRAAALKAWTPAKDAETCPKRICDIWATLYAAVRTADPECDATPMLAPFMGLSFDGANVYVTARDLSLRNFLETPEHLPALRSVLAAQFGADKKLIYRTPRK